MRQWRFREPGFGPDESVMKAPVIFDGRTLCPPGKMARRGFTYVYLGKKLRYFTKAEYYQVPKYKDSPLAAPMIPSRKRSMV